MYTMMTTILDEDTSVRILSHLNPFDSPILKPRVTLGFSDLRFGHRSEIINPIA
jgi:hypothetical protein